MDRESELSARLKAEAIRLGFDQVGIAPAVAPPDYPRFLDWLALGHGAGIDYLHRQAEARAHPDRVLEGVRSVIMASVVYGRPAGEAPGPSEARIARYAQGGDYHPLLWRRLEALLGWLERECPGIRGRAVADSAPLLERDYARLAGLGWVGKNTMLIDRQLGSFTVLGALLVDIALAYDRPHQTNHCGSCTRCLDACPTDAFAGPYELDANRCISYWTIEHKGLIPDEFAGRLDDWVFGCDVCQDVCPWNRKAPAGREPVLEPRDEWVHPDLIEWLGRDPSEFSRSLKGTALARTKRAGLIRNAAAILGARREARAVPALVRLLDDAEPVVRAAAARALAAIATDAADQALANRRDDPDPAVREAAGRVRERGRE